MRIRGRRLISPTLFATASGGGGGGGTTTLDGVNLGSGLTLSGGALIATQSGSGYTIARTLASHTTGLFYWEWTLGGGNADGDYQLGIVNASEALNSFIGSDNNGGGSWGNSGNFFTNNGTIGTVPSFSSPHTMGMAANFGTGLFWLRQVTSPTVWNAGGSADPVAGVGGISFSNITGPYFAACSISAAGSSMALNAGGSAYAAAAPTAYGNL